MAEDPYTNLCWAQFLETDNNNYTYNKHYISSVFKYISVNKYVMKSVPKQLLRLKVATCKRLCNAMIDSKF